MIRITFGTATVKVHPSLATRADNGAAQEQYEFADLASCVVGVLRAAGYDPQMFAEQIRRAR